MSSRVSRRILIVFVVAVAFATNLTLATSDSGAPAPVSAGSMVLDLANHDEGSACDVDVVDSTSALEGVFFDGLLDLSVAEPAAANSCRPCTDRKWCKCTYNGLPRVSCSPCCYGNLGIPQVCLD